MTDQPPPDELPYPQILPTTAPRLREIHGRRQPLTDAGTDLQIVVCTEEGLRHYVNATQQHNIMRLIPPTSWTDGPTENGRYVLVFQGGSLASASSGELLPGNGMSIVSLRQSMNARTGERSQHGRGLDYDLFVHNTNGSPVNWSVEAILPHLDAVPVPAQPLLLL